MKLHSGCVTEVVESKRYQRWLLCII